MNPLGLKSSPTMIQSPLLVNSFPDIRTRPTFIQLKSSKRSWENQLYLVPIKCIHSPDKSFPKSSEQKCPTSCCLTMSEAPVQSLNVAEKVHYLAMEFKSLSEPIERVKRLLHYAALLPPFDESARSQENRVMGCTTMVWLDVAMDENRLMRFRVDSDSEITKGFSSCLIWLLDGAAPEEILGVKIDDLMEMNVGFPSRGHSRVNTWHNILISMQKKTQNLVEQKNREQSLKDFPHWVVNPNGITINGSHKEAQSKNSTIGNDHAEHMHAHGKPDQDNITTGVQMEDQLKGVARRKQKNDDAG